MFLLATAFTLALGPAQPPLQWIPWVISPVIKRTGCEAEQTTPSTDKVKKEQS